jgi:hypothetical protein
MAIRSATGIEAFVWLTDVAHLSRRDATDLMRDLAKYRPRRRCISAHRAPADG